MSFVKSAGAFLKGLVGGGAREVADVAIDIIEQFHGKPMSEEEKQRAKDRVLEAAERAEQRDQERAKLGFEMLKIEQTSADPYVRRARPTWLYVYYIIVGGKWVLFPVLDWITSILLIVGKFQGDHAPMLISSHIPPLPAWMGTTFTAAFLGYVGARSYDKKQATGSLDLGDVGDILRGK